MQLSIGQILCPWRDRFESWAGSWAGSVSPSHKLAVVQFPCLAHGDEGLEEFFYSVFAGPGELTGDGFGGGGAGLGEDPGMTKFK